MLKGDDGKSKLFPSLKDAAEAINEVTEPFGFRVSAAGGYVKCVRYGKPRKKPAEGAKESRNRKSQKCGCRFSLRVCVLCGIPPSLLLAKAGF